MLILLADDHELIRESVKLVLSRNHFECDFLEAQDYCQTLNHIKANQHIDIILLNLSMPGMGRVAGLKQVRQSAPYIPIIILSVFEGTEDINEAFMCGANGYVPKSSVSKTLSHTVNQVMQGQICLPSPFINTPEITTGTRYETSAHCHYKLLPEFVPNNEAMLTPRQKNVLQFLAGGYTNKEIAQKLSISESTVKSHLSNIYQALGVSTRAEAICTALNLKTLVELGKYG